MIKILPLNKNNFNPKNKYFLEVSIGYGEHCDDTYTENIIEINDNQVLNKKYDEDGFPIDDEGFVDWNYYITVKEAEYLVKFFKKILEKMDHIVLNEGIKDYWFEDELTKSEIKELKEIYDKYNNYLFNPRIDNNWYGVVSVKIIYYDEYGELHNCEVI